MSSVDVAIRLTRHPVWSEIKLVASKLENSSTNLMRGP